MKLQDILISENNGRLYADKSGDKNLIHINDRAGYNSIYDEKICHGCNILEQFLNNTSFQKFNKLFIKFEKHFVYNEKIKIKKKKKNLINLFQQDTIKAKIYIENSKSDNFKLNLDTKKYKFFKLKKIQKKITFKKKIFKLLDNLSFHVGMIFPGINSIINDIKIYNYNNKLIGFKNGIYSRLTKKGYPFIENYIIFEKLIIEFNTTIRPSHKILKKKINCDLINNVKKLDLESTLIIGGSGALGSDLIKIFLKNKKIKIFATYFKNKIYNLNKNIKYLKINILKDQTKMINLIKKEQIDTIFYFPTTRISMKANKEQKKLYKKIYVEIPIEMLKKIFSFQKKIRFLYPSTIFIDNRYLNSDYAKTKLIAEKKLTNLAKKNKLLKLSMPRLKQLNSKQNLNILNYKYPSLIEILNQSKRLQKYFFLKD